MMKEAGVELVSIKEGVDFGTKYGKAMLGMFGVVAELESDILTEQMLENRIARGRKGFPTSGSRPIGRTFDKETQKWSLDKTVAKDLQWAASEYLKGRALHDIVRGLSFPITYDALRVALKDRCGDSWEVCFNGGDVLKYKIPRILDDDTITRIHERFAFNRVQNRKDIKNKYVLSGFIYCEKCKRTLTGQTLGKGKYTYYRHQNKYGDKKCVPRLFNQINGTDIEEAVFQAIFENILDVPSFEAAIAKSLPDEKTKAKLEAEINSDKKALRRVNEKLEKLVESVLEGTLKKETIQKKEEGLIKQKDRLWDTLDHNERRFKNLPDLESVKKEAAKIRRLLIKKYSGMEHYDEMSFKEKRELLHWVFDGRGPSGDRYGIYINKKGKGKDATIDYFLYGRVTGLRTIKGDDPDFFPDNSVSSTDTNYNTKLVAGLGKVTKKKY